VTHFDLQAIEQRVGVTLDASQFAGWDNKPVMLATAIVPATR
jgi:hypothetical protein